jgi:UDPglucose 6-dehydrogenase
MKIAIAGTGYVGLSNGILLAQHHEVVALDVVAAKVDQINRKELPIEDAEMEDYLRTEL